MCRSDATIEIHAKPGCDIERGHILRHSSRIFAAVPLALALLAGVLTLPGALYGQEDGGKPQSEDPPAAVISALSAACKQDEAGFSKYLTKENAESFHGLPIDQRKAVLRRFSLSDDPGKPLLVGDLKGRTVLRCENPAATSEFHVSPGRVDENLAFVSIEIAGGTETDFGLIRQSGP